MGFNDRRMKVEDFNSGKNLRTNRIFNFKVESSDTDRRRFTLTSGLELNVEEIAIVINGFNDIKERDTLDLGSLGKRVAIRVKNNILNSPHQRFRDDLYNDDSKKYLIIQ